MSSILAPLFLANSITLLGVLIYFFVCYLVVRLLAITAPDRAQAWNRIGLARRENVG
jgi:hypothetical protein